MIGDRYQFPGDHARVAGINGPVVVVPWAQHPERVGKMDTDLKNLS